jgi:hypothetical protein
MLSPVLLEVLPEHHHRELEDQGHLLHQLEFLLQPQADLDHHQLIILVQQDQPVQEFQESHLQLKCP